MPLLCPLWHQVVTEMSGNGKQKASEASEDWRQENGVELLLELRVFSWISSL